MCRMHLGKQHIDVKCMPQPSDIITHQLEDKSLSVPAGLAVLLHHELTVPCGFFKKDKKMLLHMPARKIVRCRTRELHQSLLVKLGSCLLEKRESLEPHQAAHFIARDVAVHMVSLQHCGIRCTLMKWLKCLLCLTCPVLGSSADPLLYTGRSPHHKQAAAAPNSS